MPNPYHDAEGKFCSRGEMQKAIQHAAETGNLEQYFELRTDFEKIENKTPNFNEKRTLTPKTSIDNITDPNSTERQEWVEGYRKLVTDYLTQNGDIKSKPGGEMSYGMYFPHVDKRLTAHLKKCGTKNISSIEEETFSVPAFDSFNNNPGENPETIITGVINCNCGDIDSKTIETRASISDVLHGLLK